MHLAALVRNVLILAGVAGGGALAVVSALGPDGGSGLNNEQPAADSPIVLNTARPLDLGKTPLNKPISLESGFGRSELTGQTVQRVPENPLDELNFDRDWDISLALTPPKPPTDLPPEKASDEVGEPQPEDVAERDEFRLANLPNAARKHASEAAADYEEATVLLKEGLKESRQPGQEGRGGFEKMAKAADIFEDARDKLEKALELAPHDSNLMELMRKIKANLFVCRKHGR